MFSPSYWLPPGSSSTVPFQERNSWEIEKLGISRGVWPSGTSSLLHLASGCVQGRMGDCCGQSQTSKCLFADIISYKIKYPCAGYVHGNHGITCTPLNFCGTTYWVSDLIPWGFLLRRSGAHGAAAYRCGSSGHLWTLGPWDQAWEKHDWTGHLRSFETVVGPR